MRTAEERAHDLLDQFHGQRPSAFALVGVLKEYARDQRHACAEAVAAVGHGSVTDSVDRILYVAHYSCMNTPFPGEGQ